MGNEDSLAVGISRNPEPKEEEGKQELWITWVVVASADEKTAVLEFALPGEDTATYVFNVENSYEEFLYVLNRVLEATSFRREMIFFSEQELKEEKNAESRIL
jgi:hypothetical protein